MAKANNHDKRFEVIKMLVDAGKLHSLQAIFDIIPISTVGTASGIHYSTLHKKIYNPGLFKIEECILLGNLFGLTTPEFINLLLNDMKNKRQKKSAG